jgi:hypothetical protein
VTLCEVSQDSFFCFSDKKRERQKNIFLLPVKIVFYAGCAVFLTIEMWERAFFTDRVLQKRATTIFTFTALQAIALLPSEACLHEIIFFIMRQIAIMACR